MAAPARIRISELQSYSPVTKHLVDRQLSASELCGITLRTSDNTAVNKVLEILGGPQAITAFLRRLGDDVTRLDRHEPALNEGRPGDPRDTTTPRAISSTLSQLTLEAGLDRSAREQLVQWMESNEVGGPLLRAGMPKDWRIADRSGAGGFGTRGVVAVIWPPACGPIVAAVYLTETDASMDARNAAISEVGRAIVMESGCSEFR